MHISDEGLRLIKSFEGYYTKQPDGSCVAYLCPAKVATIGWGCTEGVKLGMRWTEAEATEGLRREISKHEAAVNRLVTVDINQHERDALISFSYNCGVGALQSSTVLKRLNKGDRAGAAAAFAAWNKGGGKVLPGLVARRAREAALFMKPTSAPDAPYMPQRVEASKEPISSKVVATGTAVVSSGAAVVTTTGGIPAPPPGIVDTVSSVSAWKGIVGHPDPLVLIGVALVAAIFGIPWIIDKWRAA